VKRDLVYATEVVIEALNLTFPAGFDPHDVSFTGISFAQAKARSRQLRRLPLP